MEHQLLNKYNLLFDYKACFTTVDELSDIFNEYLTHLFPSLTHATVYYDDEDTLLLDVLNEDEAEEEWMNDEDLERYCDLFGNPQEKIMTFRIVLEKIFGKGAIAELVDDDNINLFVPVESNN